MNTRIDGPRHHGLHVRFGDRRGDPPRADSSCPCGATARAKGRDNVLGLIARWTDHRNTCPERTRTP